MICLLFPVMVAANDSLTPTAARAGSDHAQGGVGSLPLEASKTSAPKTPNEYTVAVYYWSNYHFRQPQ